MKDEYKNWLNQAEKDFDAAKYNLEGNKTEQGVFFLQQSAEKALKSLYIKKFKDLFKTHDLILLAKKLNAPEKIIDYCKELNPAYQYTRYPDIPSMENLNEIEDELVKYAEEILKWVKKNI